MIRWLILFFGLVLLFTTLQLDHVRSDNERLQLLYEDVGTVGLIVRTVYGEPVYRVSSLFDVGFIDPVWSPNGHYFLALLGGDGGARRAIVVYDVRDPFRPSHFRVPNDSLSVSPIGWLADGDHFVLLAEVPMSGVQEVWLLEAATGNITSIDTLPMAARVGQWSVQAEAFVFAPRDPPPDADPTQQDFYRYNLRTAEVVHLGTLANEPTNAYGWSPDLSQGLVRVPEDGQVVRLLYDVQTKTFSPVLFLAEAADGRYRWSPSGAWIGFVNEDHEFVRIRPDGSGRIATPLPDALLQPFHWKWSANDQWLMVSVRSADCPRGGEAITIVHMSDTAKQLVPPWCADLTYAQFIHAIGSSLHIARLIGMAAVFGLVSIGQAMWRGRRHI